MSTANEHGLWRRARFTPVTDAMRGRLTGRLDLERLLADSGLPADATGLVRDVVRRTRLWRAEQIDVAAELLAHFHDGLEHGLTSAELVRSFGEPRAVARLIRRAKKRSRPWPWHVMRATGLAVCALLGVYVLAALVLLMGRPDMSVDYIARLNEAAAAVPDEDRAWPIYREALNAGLRDLALDAFVVHQAQQIGRRAIRRDDPGWPEAAALVREHAESLELIRQGAAKPGLGLTVGHTNDFALEDLRAFRGPDYEPADRQPSPRGPERLAQGSIHSVLLPHLGEMRKMARLLAADTELALDQDDHERVLANLRAMLGLARHSREQPFLANSLVAIANVSIAMERAGDLLHRDPQRWSRAELAELAHLFAGADPLLELDAEGLDLMMRDTLQRLYSERGTVTRDGLHAMVDVVDMDATPLVPQLAAVAPLTLPAVSVLVADRAEMERQGERLLDLWQRETAMAMWQRMERMPYDEALRELHIDARQAMRYFPLLAGMPPVSAAAGARDLAIARRDALLVAIAMELHRRDHGRHPDTLAELSPRYLPEPPVDHSTGGPLRVAYPEDERFVLYGLGLNGEDNGGTLSDDGRRFWPRVPDRGDWVLYPPVIGEPVAGR